MSSIEINGNADSDVHSWCCAMAGVTGILLLARGGVPYFVGEVTTIGEMKYGAGSCCKEPDR